MDMETKDIGFDKRFVRNMVESALRIGLIFVLLALTYNIIRPFIIPLVWGGIIAIAAFPLTKRIEGFLGGRRGLAATLLTLFMILVLVVPCYQITESLLKAAKSVSDQIQSGGLQIPSPNESVADWPLVGDKVYASWSLAHENFQETLQQVAPRLKSVAANAASTLGNGLVGILMFVVSLIIAGVLMTYAEASSIGAHRLFVRLAGEKPGGEWDSLCVATVRNVLQGVVGVALIQATLCAIGIFVLGIPGAAIWSAAILFLAIAQLPPLIVVLPLVLYAFSSYDTTPAVIFTVWMLLSGLSDNLLKPLFMGRGLDIPMPVILIGAIGGMVASGIIGLFTGAVVLSICYKVFCIWMEQEKE